MLIAFASVSPADFAATPTTCLPFMRLPFTPLSYAASRDIFRLIRVPYAHVRKDAFSRDAAFAMRKDYLPRCAMHFYDAHFALYAHVSMPRAMARREEARGSMMIAITRRVRVHY